MSATTRVAAAAAALAASPPRRLAACGKDDDNPAAGEKPAKLIVDTFGEFGYDDLVKQYEQHTGIKVELRKTAQLDDYRPKLVRDLATGQGAADVVALEEGIINEFKINPANWVDLTPLVGDLRQRLPALEVGAGQGARRQAHRPADRRRQPRRLLPHGTCSRRPACRSTGTRSAALWPDWNKFIETGKKYRAATGKGMLDSVTTAASADHVPGRRRAASTTRTTTVPRRRQDETWSRRERGREAGLGHRGQDDRRQHHRQDRDLVAGVDVPASRTAPSRRRFCPSWMTGIVKDNSGPDNKGKWDVAAVPGGAGNWGGSWLCVPTPSKYPKEAAELAKFLTNAQSQVAAFKLKGPLPTNLTALKNPDVPGLQERVLQQRADRQDLR